MSTQHLRTLAIASLCAGLLGGCNTEWGFDTGDGSKPPKYPTLDKNRPQSFALPSVGTNSPNTLESYNAAIEQNTDYISASLVMSKDAKLVALGSPNITDITDIQSHTEFANRKTTQVIDGQTQTGWFASDFTLAELQTLRIRPSGSDITTPSPNLGQIQSLEQIIRFAKQQSRIVGLYLQTMHPTYHNKLKLPMEDALVAALSSAGYTQKNAPVLVRSFEVAHLQALRKKTGVRLVQMIDGSALNANGSIQLSPPHDQPYDFTVSGSKTTYQDMVTTSGLAAIKSYADGISPWKVYIASSATVDANNDDQPDDLNGDGVIDERDRIMLKPSSLVSNAHAADLFVHPWPFYSNANQLASDFEGNPAKEYQLFYKLGVDGVFSASPEDANKAR